MIHMYVGQRTFAAVFVLVCFLTIPLVPAFAGRLKEATVNMIMHNTSVNPRVHTDVNDMHRRIFSLHVVFLC